MSAPSFSKFLIELDQCTFLPGSFSTEADTHTAEAGLAKQFAPPPEDYNIEICRIKVAHVIDGVKYDFISPIYTAEIENLRVRIGFLKNSWVFYNPENLNESYFEL